MSYTGMHRSTGRAISDINHLRQSVADILMTPLGSRVMRRDYGSLLPELIDQPISGALRLKAMGAAVMALVRWEPRLRPSRVDFVVSEGTPNSVTIELTASLTTGPLTGKSISLSVPLKGALL